MVFNMYPKNLNYLYVPLSIEVRIVACFATLPASALFIVVAGAFLFASFFKVVIVAIVVEIVVAGCCWGCAFVFAELTLFD